MSAPPCERPRRILHLWLPELPTDRLLRQRWRADQGQGGQSLSPAPFATIEKVRGALVLSAVDGAAREAGLAPGMTLAEARAQQPALRVADADADADAALLRQLARAADRYTPLVGLDPPAGLFLDISGCAHLFGGEADLARDLLMRVAHWGFKARAGVADTPAVAWGIARFAPLLGSQSSPRDASYPIEIVGRNAQTGPLIVPAGQGAEALDRLPVEALRLPAEMVAVLSRLGLKSVAQVRAQPRVPLIQRFGRAMAQRLDQIDGVEQEPITPLTPIAPYVAERNFAEPLMQVEAIHRVLERLAVHLCEQLRHRAEGARRLRLRLFHADGTVREATLATADPLADPHRIAVLFKPQLEALSGRIETDSGIDLIRLYADETGPFAARQSDLMGDGDALGDLAELIDTLTQRLGAAAVERFVHVDTHQPDDADGRVPARSALTLPQWPERGQMAAAVVAQGDPANRPLRLLRTPEPVETLASVPDGPPVRFVWRRISHHVVAAEGPERIAPHWWAAPTSSASNAAASSSQAEAVTAEPQEAAETLGALEPAQSLTCDYFRVEDAQGRRFWMFRRGLYGRESAAPQWFIHGLFA